MKTFFGTAHPWLCDIMGHLNTRSYAAMFDDACAQYLAALGSIPIDVAENRIGWAHVRGEIEYRAEILLGESVTIDSATECVGTKSLTMFSEMRGTASGVLHATIRSTLVRFDLEKRRSNSISDEIRNAANALVKTKPCEN